MADGSRCLLLTWYREMSFACPPTGYCPATASSSKVPPCCGSLPVWFLDRKPGIKSVGGVSLLSSCTHTYIIIGTPVVIIIVIITIVVISIVSNVVIIILLILLVYYYYYCTTTTTITIFIIINFIIIITSLLLL